MCGFLSSCHRRASWPMRSSRLIFQGWKTALKLNYRVFVIFASFTNIQVKSISEGKRHSYQEKIPREQLGSTLHFLPITNNQVEVASCPSSPNQSRWWRTSEVDPWLLILSMRERERERKVLLCYRNSPFGIYGQGNFLQMGTAAKVCSAPHKERGEGTVLYHLCSLCSLSCSPCKNSLE